MNPRTPPAEVAVDVGLGRRLLAAQHPDLASLPLALAPPWALPSTRRTPQPACQL